MSLFHRIEKYLGDNNKKPGDFRNYINLTNDGKRPVGTDVDGYRITKWNKTRYGPQPTLSQLPKDAVSVQWCKDEAAKLKIGRQAWDDAKSVDELKALLRPDHEKRKLFNDQV